MEIMGLLGRRRRCRFGGLVVSLRGLDHEAHFDGFRGHLDAADGSVNDGAYALNVGLELALGDAGGFSAYAAEILRFTLASNGSAGSSSLAGKITNTGHTTPQRRTNKRYSSLPRKEDESVSIPKRDSPASRSRAPGLHAPACPSQVGRRYRDLRLWAKACKECNGVRVESLSQVESDVR